MLADTDAIRTLGSATTEQAVELAAVAASLSLPGEAAAMLGPVGAGFLTALTEAAAEVSRAAAALSDRASSAGTTARATAAAYDQADHDAGALIDRF